MATTAKVEAQTIMYPGGGCQSAATHPYAAHGIDEAHAAELRARLSTFAADWDGAEMDVYDDYDASRARLQPG